MAEQGGNINLIEAEAGLIALLIQKQFGSLDILLQGYTGERFIRETATNGSHIIDNPHISMLYYIQPEILTKLFAIYNYAECGFTPRITPFYIPKCEHLGTINNAAYEKFNAKIEKLVTFCYSQREQEQAELYLSQDALEAVLDFEQNCKLRAEQSEVIHIDKYLGKAHGKVVSIAAMLHVWEHLENASNINIQLNSIEAAISLVEASIDHAAFAYSEQNNQVLRYAGKTIEWIRKHRHTKFSSRDLQRGTGANAQLAEEVIFLLNQYNYIAHARNGQSIMCLVNRNFS